MTRGLLYVPVVVAGMPVGSSGFEGALARPYNVMSFDDRGETSVFSTQWR